jgi:acetyl-CoA carboxylase biotin carboxyl carrier protein
MFVSGVSRDDLDALVQIFESSSWDRLDLVLADVELHISKSGSQVSHSEVPRPVDREAPERAVTKSVRGSDAAERPVEVPHGMLEIRAPHLGTFYRAPKPGAPPYIEMGQKVSPETEVCLLEVMKLFTTLRAGLSGIVRKVCVTDSTLVEGGQALFLIEPEG